MLTLAGGSMASLLTSGCGVSGPPAPGAILARSGDEVIAAGVFVHSGTSVVTWLDEGGYDAYRPHRHLAPESAGPSGAPTRIARYGSLRRALPDEVSGRVAHAGWSLRDLSETVSQVVIHFDACGTSRRCFEVLHDVRGLSCHFLLDLDGTVYQTLDLKERAWHAAQANDRSIGIEIAHIGAHASEEPLARWYAEDEQGLRVSVPENVPRGALPEDYRGTPARSELFRGTINGRELVQYDFTEAQYVALERLLLALCRTFPRIKARVPRGEDGELRRDVFGSDEELHAFEGLIAHWHVSRGKVDPGPAFDWDRILDHLRQGGIEP